MSPAGREWSAVIWVQAKAKERALDDPYISLDTADACGPPQVNPVAGSPNLACHVRRPFQILARG